MDREKLKERLLQTGMNAELVDDFLATLKDEDLLRMKDMSAEEIVASLKDAVEEVADEGDPPAEEDVDAGDPPEETDDTADIAAVLKEFGDGIVSRVVEQLQALEITVETPEMAQIVEQLKEIKEENAALKTTLKEMQSAWDEILKTDKERLSERLKELSPAARVHLRATLGDKDALDRVTQFLREQVAAGDAVTQPPVQDNIFRRPMAGPGEVRIVDSDGKEYESLGALARGQAKS